MGKSRDQNGSIGSKSNLFGVSIISEELLISGNVRSKSTLHIEGRILGDVSCGSLVLGEKSRLEGNVIAEEVVVRGHLIGSVRALKVMLQPTSRVEGELHHKELDIKHGAYFDGSSRRSDDPLAHHSNGSAHAVSNGSAHAVSNGSTHAISNGSAHAVSNGSAHAVVLDPGSPQEQATIFKD